jgi:hypothetical protein
MDRLKISSIIGKLIEKYVCSAIEGKRDCRLLVPGLTENIGRQVHEYLAANLPSEVSTYLVIGENELPNEDLGFIRPIGLTSKRIGSFVAIASPGQLAHIQDSIRGSGGTIRSLVFSEEWPWIDNGSEPFRFDGPVLSELVKGWSNDPIEQDWLREFALKGLIVYTRSSSGRAGILLEKIFGTFSPELYPEIGDIKEKILYHAGIPRPSGTIGSVDSLIKNSTSLCKKIVDRCQREDDIREQARDEVKEIVPQAELASVISSLDLFLDGVGQSSTLDLDLLAFHGCWGRDSSDTINWRNLDADRLGDIFRVKPREKAKVTYDISCQKGILSENHKKVATFYGEKIDLFIDYEIKVETFQEAKWAVQILYRSKKIIERLLVENQGHIELQLDTKNITERYSRKIPIRIAIVSGNDVMADVKLDLHLCGQERPAFTVIEHSFSVFDATIADDEEPQDKKIVLSEPARVFLLNNNSVNISVRDEDNIEIILEELSPGILQSTQRVDLASKPSGQAIWNCKFDNLTAVICFEASDIKKGEFTIEDELRTLISHSDSSEKRIKSLVHLFKGENAEPYPILGKIDEAARRRIHLAKILTTHTGWKPLLTNLIENIYFESDSLGDFVTRLGPVEGEAFKTLAFPDTALSLIKEYIDTRTAVLDEIKSHLDTGETSSEHPVYASHPIYVNNCSTKIEPLLCKYLEAYQGILAYLHTPPKDLEWEHLFVLAHLDCVVQWDKTRLRNSFFLIGPWHPLVISKRYMVQSVQYLRADRLLHDDNGKQFRNLTALCSKVQGFRWLLGLSANETLIEPAYVSITSDPGWHIAFMKSFLEMGDKEASLTNVSNSIWRTLGLGYEMGVGVNQGLAITALSNYMLSFPSRRSIGIHVRKGYAGSEIVKNVDSFLHTEDGLTENGTLLPGGVRIYLEEPLEGDVEEVKWTNPPLCVYQFKNDEEFIKNANPDIFMLSPKTEISIKDSLKEYILPRGLDNYAVFSEPLRWLTGGHNLVPTSVAYEFDVRRETNSGLGGTFIETLGAVNGVTGKSYQSLSPVDLPERLNAPWVVIPGASIDPAALVKYVHDGATKKIQERALWDYKLDVSNPANSFFILSSIPRGFQVAVNGFFEKDVASEFIVELGKIGIAIGGEALKSGRHALGIIGLVGAVRLMTGKTADGRIPLSNSSNTIGFILPVDSFESFFGTNNSSNGKRTDLLAIQLVLPDINSDKIQISACGIESKFVSGTFGITRAHDALAQAESTVEEFKTLVVTSLRQDSLPERLAVIELLQFGLRIISPSWTREPEKWIEIERIIYQSILLGKYEYHDATHRAVLVSTEGNLPGVAEPVILQEGLWVRLTKSQWPKTAEAPQIENIRQLLCAIFDSSCKSSSLLPQTENQTSSDQGSAGADIVKLTETPAPDIGVIELPLENSTEIPELPEIRAQTPFKKIIIGVDNARAAKYFDPQSPVDPLDNLNVMVTGSSGTGKTQFLKYLICELRNQEKNVLIIDFKNDFASDSKFSEKACLDRIFINFDGLPYNPLIPYPIKHPATGDLFIQPGQHIAGITSVLKRTYTLGDQQAAALKNSIVAAFDASGIPSGGTIRCIDNTKFPDFGAVGKILEHDNLKAYNRLEPLFSLGLFKPEYRSVSFHELTDKSMVIDMSQVSSDEIKNALAQLVVMSAHAYFNSLTHSGTIRQMFVIDEAFRVLDYEFMADFVLQCRAYGVGMVLSSQYPSQFPPDVSSSMATKIIHGNGRDSNRIRDIVHLIRCEGREADIAALDRFQAFIDNRHNPHTLLRTMNYPLYLVWSKLRECGKMTREDLSVVDGINPSMLSIGNLIHQLELMGLAEEKDGYVSLLN